MHVNDLKELVRPYRKDTWLDLNLNFFFNDNLMSVFEKAPASTKWHGSYKGGLLDHTFAVVKNTINLYPSFASADMTVYSAIEAALWHDVGKAGLLDYNGDLIEPYYIPSEDGFVYNDELNFSHQELSCIAYVGISSNSIDIEVLKAIRYHNMLYTDSKTNIGNETPLMLIVHFADMIASRFEV